jgi:hypothetical protein
VELYQKGYGKDAANVAKDAVTFGTQEGFDVVLIDTAGRRHNDQVRRTAISYGLLLTILPSGSCPLWRNLQSSPSPTRYSWLEK